jgi:hypothetical protein
MPEQALAARQSANVAAVDNLLQLNRNNNGHCAGCLLEGRSGLGIANKASIASRVASGTGGRYPAGLPCIALHPALYVLLGWLLDEHFHGRERSCVYQPAARPWRPAVRGIERRPEPAQKPDLPAATPQDERFPP